MLHLRPHFSCSQHDDAVSFHFVLTREISPQIPGFISLPSASVSGWVFFTSAFNFTQVFLLSSLCGQHFCSVLFSFLNPRDFSTLPLLSESLLRKKKDPQKKPRKTVTFIFAQKKGTIFVKHGEFLLSVKVYQIIPHRCNKA